jgi:hypothetical protein
LRVLSMESNGIRCRGAAHLARILNVSGTRWERTFGGYRAPNFGPGRGLQQLYLAGNLISSVGARAVAEVLARSDYSLETLDLQGNQIDDWSAGWLAEVLRNNNVLRRMDLRRNPIGVDGIEELTAACHTARCSLVAVWPNGTDPAGEIAVSVSEPAPVETDREAILVAGQRQATVYVTCVDSVPSATERQVKERINSVADIRAFRPGSASRREGSCTKRHNSTLDLDEPGAVMINSAGVCRSSSDEAGSAPNATRRRGGQTASPSCVRDVGGGAAPRRIGGRTAPTPAVSTYSAVHAHAVSSAAAAQLRALSANISSARREEFGYHDGSLYGHGPLATASSSRPLSAQSGRRGRPQSAQSKDDSRCDSDPVATATRSRPSSGRPSRPQSAQSRGVASLLSYATPVVHLSPRDVTVSASTRDRPGERGVATDEKETTIALGSPSRWRRKLRHEPRCGRATGCGAAAARRLPKSRSVPCYHRRMLLGPMAAAQFC